MSAHDMQIGNDDINDDINDEDLDAFLVLLESRLRADFTSPDLSRIISSQGASNSSSTSASSSSLLSTLPSGNASSPSKFLRLIHLVFSKAGKSIKLRSLMSVLGLDDDATVELSSRNAANSTSVYAAAASSNNNHTFKEEDELIKGKKTDAIVYKLLNQAENDDEKWVRVVAGIIKRLMFINHNHNNSFNNNETTTTNTKETESEKQLRKITTNILSTIEKTYMNANNKFNETKTQLTNKIHIESTDDIEVQQKLSKLDDSNIKSTYLIGLDSYPTYTPLYYTLVSSSLIEDIIPQLNDTNNNPHFTSNMNADILKVDGEVEKKRAEEEGKEITNVNMKKSSRLLPSSTNNGSGIAGTSSNVGGRGRGNGINNNSTNGNVAGRGGPILAGRITSTRRGVSRGGGSSSSGASLFRPSSTLGRGGGRGGGGRFGGGGRATTSGGRSGSLSRLVAAGGRGTGGRVGSISAPLQRRVPGAARSALLNSSNSGRGSVSSAGRGGRGGGGGGGGSSISGGGTGETKMKMIDASEVEDLTRAAAEREKTANLSTVQARKLERKRKLMESAAASGLRNREKKKKKKIAAPDGGDTTAAGTTPSGGSNDQAVSAATAAVSQNESNNTGIVGQQQQPQQQQHSAASITSLLEKSNKLSPEDRQTIFQFFQNRNNNQGSMSQPASPPGTDESGIWRVKLNEDKAFDESTGEVVKETLYLELDYKSLGYKKTRKIKRK